MDSNQSAAALVSSVTGLEPPRDVLKGLIHRRLSKYTPLQLLRDPEARRLRAMWYTSTLVIPPLPRVTFTVDTNWNGTYRVTIKKWGRPALVRRFAGSKAHLSAMNWCSKHGGKTLSVFGLKMG